MKLTKTMSGWGRMALAFTIGLSVSGAFATDYAWNGGASGEWTTADNWQPNTGYPNGAGDTASFTPSAATAVTVGSAVEVQGITVGGTSALTITGAAITLGSGGITNTSTQAVGISNNLVIATAKTPLAVTGNGTLSSSNPAGPLHLGGVVSGSGGLYKTGSGELHLYGANTFTGDYEALGNRITKTGATIPNLGALGSGETFIYDGSALGATHAYFDKGMGLTDALGARLVVAATMTIDIPIQLTGDYNNNFSLMVKENCDVTFTGDVDSKGRARLNLNATNAKARFKGKLTHSNYMDLHLYASGAEVFLHKLIVGSNWLGDGGAGGKVHLYGVAGSTASVNWFQQNGIFVCEDENVIPPKLNYFEVQTANCGIELNGFDQKISYINLAKMKFSAGAMEKISSPVGRPAKMRFVGTSVPSFGMVARFDGTAGMEWDPQSESTVYTQSNTVSSTTGELDIKSGVYRLANGATFTKLSSFKLADGASFEVESGSGANFLAYAAEIGSGASFNLANGVNLSFGALKIGIDTIPEGAELTAATHPDLITGNGKITVTGVLPEASWIGPANGLWSDPANWSIGQVPDMNYDVMLANASVLVDAAIAPVHAITVGDGTAATTITVTNANSTLTANYFTVLNNGTVTCTGPFTNEMYMSRVHIVCTNLSIAAGGKIDVTQKGWSGAIFTNVNTKYTAVSNYGFGPGGGGLKTGGWAGFSGAWHGGRGAAYWALSKTDKVIYGDAAHPVTPGSGGEMPIAYGGEVYRLRGWSGGGVVRIEAAKEVVVNGSILANGGGGGLGNSGSSRDTAASGGSVWITCKTLSGSGTISAEGGSMGDPRYPVSYWRDVDTTDLKYGFPGGGGRIAIDYDPVAQAAADVTGLMVSAAAGEYFSGYSSLATRDNWEDAAESGTLHFTDTALVKRLFGKGISGRVVGLTGLSFDGDLDFTRGFFQPMEEGFTLTVAGNLTVTGTAARLEVGGVCLTNLSSRPTIWGGRQMNLLTVGGDFTVAGGGSFAIRAAETNASMRWGAEVRVAGAMTVGSNGYVYASSDGVNFGAPRFLPGSLTVASGGTLSADKRGGLGRHVDASRRSFGFPSDLNNNYSYGPGGGYKPNAAGHGGRGGRSGIVGAALYGIYGEPYDDEWFPIWPGSGGGCDAAGTANYGAGGTGGGIIHVTTPGAIVVDGKVSADGGMDAYYSTDNMYRFGAGSGGTVFLFGETFTGGDGAQITVKGGDGYQRKEGNQLSGTGAGGRIAVWTGYGIHESGMFRAQKHTECPFEFDGSFSAAAGVRLLPPGGTQTNSVDDIAFSLGGEGTVRFGEYVRLPGIRIILR